jgi:uncharacterized protein (DUF58 family)
MGVPAGTDRGSLELGARRTSLRKPAGLVFVLAAAALLLWLPWQSEGRLLLAAGFVLAAILDRVVSRRALTDPDIRIEAPPQATVGLPVSALLSARAGRYPLRVETLWMWPTLTLAVDSDAPGLIDLPASARGVVRAALVDLAVSGPLGLFETRRRARTWFPSTMDVAPAPLVHDLDWPALRTIAFGLTETSPQGQDLFRGVRPYAPGDPRRLVHWKATAHERSLMVKEADGTGIVALRVVLRLDAPGLQAEAAVARARYVIEEARRRLWHVHLVTVEPVGEVPPPPVDDTTRSLSLALPDAATGATVTVARRVRSTADLVHRLAAATFGTPSLRRWRGETVIISAGADQWL